MNNYFDEIAFINDLFAFRKDDMYFINTLHFGP